MLKQARLFVKGDVTGVGFRAWVKIQTKTSPVTGWVRNVYNHPDIFGPHGGVEVFIQGDSIMVEDMIDAVRSGPPIARVVGVDVIYETPTDICEDFSIRKSEAFLHR